MAITEVTSTEVDASDPAKLEGSGRLPNSVGEPGKSHKIASKKAI